MRALLVDDGRYINDTAKQLRNHGHDALLAESPQEARKILRSQEVVECAFIDVLFKPNLDDLDRDRQAGRISVERGLFCDSGLAVLDAIATYRPSLPTAIWSESLENRRLHMIHAFQWYKVRNFYSKDAVGAAEAMSLAITETINGTPFIDKSLYESGVGQRHWPDLGKTLFPRSDWAAIWRAIALGATSHEEIREKIRSCVRKYRRETLGDMALAADSMSAISEYNGNALAFCIAFAARQRSFLLDVTIKKHFP